MKKLLSVILALTVLLCALPALAEDDGGIDVLCSTLTMNNRSKSLAYRGEGEKFYQVMDMNGTILTDLNAGYTSMYPLIATGYFSVEVQAADGIHREGLLDSQGKVLVPPVYADVSVISSRWQAGVKLVPCNADEKDYTYTSWGSDEKLFYRVDTVDIYFDGELAGTLTRADYSDATAHGAYLAVHNQAREITFYNGKMEPSPYKANGTREYNSVYANGAYTYYHQGSGQQAFVPGCTLTAEEVETPYQYDIASRTLYDLQGNAVFTSEQEYNSVSAFHQGYARVSRDGHYGVIDMQGREVVQAVYDDVSNYSDVVFSYGYASVTKDEKIGFINDQGQETVPFSYAESAVDEHGAFAEIRDLDGSVIVISAAVGQLKDKYAEVDFPSSRESFAFVAKDSEGRLGAVDLYGRTQVPFGEYLDLYLSYDGSLALVRLDYGQYRLLHLDTSVPDAETLARTAADNGEWTCSNGHSGNTRNFCPEYGEPRPR